MRYKEVKSNFVREIAVLKARTAAHGRRIMFLEITGRGIVLHAGR
jgi:KaiC/GvpD/RAD55 family RecA-like ATPase